MSEFNPIKRAFLFVLPLLMLVGILAFSLFRLERIRDKSPIESQWQPEEEAPTVVTENEDHSMQIESAKMTATVSRIHQDRMDVLDGMDSNLVAKLDDLGVQMAEGKISEIGAAIRLITELNDSSIRPISPHRLLNFIPKTLPGFTTSERTSGTSGLLGIAAAGASGKYRGEDGQAFHLRIIDSGTMKNLAELAGSLIGAADLTGTHKNTRIRTGEIQGFEAFEKTGLKTGVSQIHLIVGPRIIVIGTAKKITPEQLRELLGTLDLQGLSALAPSEE